METNIRTQSRTHSRMHHFAWGSWGSVAAGEVWTDPLLESLQRGDVYIVDAEVVWTDLVPSHGGF